MSFRVTWLFEFFGSFSRTNMGNSEILHVWMLDYLHNETFIRVANPPTSGADEIAEIDL